MKSNLLRASVQRVAYVDRLERQLRRYRPQFQRAVRALALRHARMADLASSFPALLFALAVPRPGLDPARAIALAIEGVALAEVSAAADVPMWLRRFPPEALAGPLMKLPDGELFRQHIANYLPRSPKLAPIWLQAVASAAALAHHEFAVWVAREIVQEPKRFKVARPRRLCLWAWFSGQPGTCGQAMIAKPWMPAMRIASAIDAADDWRVHVSLHVNLGRDPIADMWLRGGRLNGYDFVPLTTVNAICEEAAAMSNCLRTYGRSLAHNHCRLFSMRKDGRRVATLSVAARSYDPLPNIVQLSGPRNARVSKDEWWAARQWLNSHELPLIKIEDYKWDSAPLNRDAWVSLWRPYWLAKRRIPEWLPMAPSRAALKAL